MKINTILVIVLIFTLNACQMHQPMSQFPELTQQIQTFNSVKPVTNIGVYFPRIRKGFRSKFEYAFKQTYLDCDKCNQHMARGTTYSTINSVSEQEVVATFFGEIKAAPEKFWSEYALQFIRTHMNQADIKHMQVSSWMTMRNAPLNTLSDSSSEKLRVLIAMLTLDGQTAMAQFQVSARNGIVRFELKSIHDTSEGRLEHSTKMLRKN